MPSYEVAHLREQGQDMIIVPLEQSFGRATTQEQESFLADFQVRAYSAGLRGTVAAVWSGGFFAPGPWHPFFRSLPFAAVLANLNRELSW